MVLFDPFTMTTEHDVDMALEALCGRYLIVGQSAIARFLDLKPLVTQRYLEGGKVARAWRRASTGEWVAFRPILYRDDDNA